MVRNRIKLNVQRKRYRLLAEFKMYANQIAYNITAKLQGGWSPYWQSENIRLYVPIKEVASEFIEEKRKELRPNTLRSYESFIRLFIGFIDTNSQNSYASLFSKLHAVRYLDYTYKRNVSIITWNNQLKMGSAFFSWAKDKCYVKENPFEGIKLKKVPKKTRILIPENDRELISNYFMQHDKQMLLVCYFMFTSLIRPNEILHIKFKHINLKDKCIIIPAEVAKNHNTRYAPLNENIITMLLELNLNKYSSEWYLFSENNILPGVIKAKRHVFSKRWVKMRNAIKLDDKMQLYSLRDTGINNMLKSGIDPLTVMQAADHHDLSMTTKYANHADPNLMQKIYDNAPKF